MEPETSKDQRPRGRVRGHLFAALLLVLLALSAVAVPPSGSGSIFQENEPPVADAGQDMTGVLENDVVSLNGSASTDEDIENCTWVWESTTHPNITVTPSNSSTPSFTVPEAGTIVFRLNLTDPHGLYSTDDVRVVVDENSDPDPMIASPPPSGPDGPFIQISTPIEFSANGSADPEGRELSYRWSSNLSGQLSTSKYFTTTLGVLGWHRITLNVSDPNGGWARESVDIKIREDMLPPEASIYISPSRPSKEYLKSEVITLDGRQTTDPNTDEILNFTWRSNVSDLLGYGEVLEVSLGEGYHNISLQVVDSDDLQSIDWIHIRIVNTPPRAFISTTEMKFRDGDPTVNVSEEAFFSAYTSSDDDGDDLEFLWEFGDGETAVGQNVTHSWDDNDVYNVTLTVDDGSMENSTDSAVFTIHVNSVPAASADPGFTVEIDERFTISANGSHDDDGDDLEYLWDFDGDDQWDASGFEVTWKYAVEGEHLVTLRVSDGFAWDETTLTIEAVFPNDAPVAAIANELVDGDVIVTMRDDRGSVELDASPSIDPDDDVNGNGEIDGDEEDNLTYTWDLDLEKDSDGDGIKDNDRDEEGKRIRVEMRKSGIMRVVLRVTDPRGAFDTMEITLKGNHPPDSLSIRVGPSYRVLVGAQVTLTGSARDPDRSDMNKLQYHWDFGDGEQSQVSSFQVFHVYEEEDTYEVILTVTDGLLESEIRTNINVVKLEEPSLSYPKNGTEVSGVVNLRGRIREVKEFYVDKVEIRIEGGEWKEADGTADWSYDLNTARYPNGELTITIRYTVEDVKPIRSSTEITLYVSNDTGSDTSYLIYLGILLVVIIVMAVIYFLFIRRKPRNIEEYLPPPPPPPGRGPQVVAPGGLPPSSAAGSFSTPPGGLAPPKKEAPEQVEPPEPEEEKPRTIRIKCPSCSKIFRSVDNGERPLHLSCKHCGAKGVIETVPDHHEVEKEEPEEEEEAPDPLPLVCPSCSGLFELTELTDTAICPHCGVEGELDEETISLLEERFGKDEEEEITLRCPTCSGTFKAKGENGPIICPYCGSKGKAAS